MYTIASWVVLIKLTRCCHFIAVRCEAGMVPPHCCTFALFGFDKFFHSLPTDWCTGSLLDFQLDVCRCLLKADQSINSDKDIANPVSISRSLSANKVPVAECYDRVNHWPMKCKKVNRCKQSGCTKRTRFICSKCQV